MNSVKQTQVKKPSIKSHWVEGGDLRIVYDHKNNLLGMIRKLESGGYRVYRQGDGKVRDKKYLSEAFRTVARKN